MKHIDPEHLEENLRSLGDKMAVSFQTFSFPSTCGVKTLEWNHMDQEHRPFIHRTYKKAIRIATGKDFALSLTQVPFLGTRIFVQVLDLKIAPGVFYQSFTLFGIIYVHVIIRALPDRAQVDWYLVSHPLFKILHPYLNKRINKLNYVQNLEDVPMRERREELAKDGYRFVTDEPDFINCNSNFNSVIPPKVSTQHRVPLKDLKPNELNKVAAGPIVLLVEPLENNAYRVWPNACPHEGAALAEGEKQECKIKCPWHGLTFDAVELNASKLRARVGGLTLALSGQDLVINPPVENAQAELGAAPGSP